METTTKPTRLSQSRNVIEYFLSSCPVTPSQAIALLRLAESTKPISSSEMDAINGRLNSAQSLSVLEKNGYAKSVLIDGVKGYTLDDDGRSEVARIISGPVAPIKEAPAPNMAEVMRYLGIRRGEG